MTHSLCSTVTVFCSVEIVLSLVAVFLVLWHPSHQCLAIHHEAALHMCETTTNGSVASAKHLAYDFSSPNDTKEAKELLTSRLEAVESIACQELNPVEFSFYSGPTHAVFYLPYFFVVNGLLCLTLFLRHRVFRMGNLFNFFEAMLVTGLMAMVLSAVLYLQHREQQEVVSSSSSSDGTTSHGVVLHAPANWCAAYSIAMGTLAWKIVQIIFHAVMGSEKKISVEHPVFKIFDFSKNYSSAETEA